MDQAKKSPYFTKIQFRKPSIAIFVVKRKSQEIFCEQSVNYAVATVVLKGSDALLGGWAQENRMYAPCWLGQGGADAREIRGHVNIH